MNFAELRSVKPHRVRRVKVTEYKVISTRGKPRVFLAQGLLITDKIRDVECPVFAFRIDLNASAKPQHPLRPRSVPADRGFLWCPIDSLCFSDYAPESRASIELEQYVLCIKLLGTLQAPFPARRLVYASPRR